jgi:hypothetical protein
MPPTVSLFTFLSFVRAEIFFIFWVGHYSARFALASRLEVVGFSEVSERRRCEASLNSARGVGQYSLRGEAKPDKSRWLVDGRWSESGGQN